MQIPFFLIVIFTAGICSGEWPLFRTLKRSKQSDLYFSIPNEVTWWSAECRDGLCFRPYSITIPEGSTFSISRNLNIGVFQKFWYGDKLVKDYPMKREVLRSNVTMEFPGDVSFSPGRYYLALVDKRHKIIAKSPQFHIIISGTSKHGKSLISGVNWSVLGENLELNVQLKHESKEPIELSLIDMSSGKKIFDETLKISELSKSITVKTPALSLSQNFFIQLSKKVPQWFGIRQKQQILYQSGKLSLGVINTDGVHFVYPGDIKNRCAICFCSIEAALRNSQRNVYIHITKRLDIFKKEESWWLQGIDSTLADRIRIVEYNEQELFNDTPLQNLPLNGKNEAAARFAILYKYGGVYLDLNMIAIRPGFDQFTYSLSRKLSGLKSAVKFTGAISDVYMNFPRRDPFLENIMREYVKGRRGSNLISREVLKCKLGMSPYKEHNPKLLSACRQISILKPKKVIPFGLSKSILMKYHESSKVVKQVKKWNSWGSYLLALPPDRMNLNPSLIKNLFMAQVMHKQCPRVIEAY